MRWCVTFWWVLVAAASAVPVVFWASDPVQPDDTVLVTGSGFGRAPRVSLLPLERGVSPRLPGELVWPMDREAKTLEAQQGTDESLKLTLPAAAEAGAWLCRIADPATGDVSAPFRLNCPTVYWLQGDQGVGQGSPGGWLRLFGRCLGGIGGGVSSVLLLADTGGARHELAPEQAGLWEVRCRLPVAVTPGSWQVFVHNGWGGSRGWTAAGTLTLAPPAAWPAAVFNVRDYGASGLGDYGDLSGIQAAVNDAEKAGGGIVYLPRGRYLFEGTLRLPRHTVLRGAGRELTALCWPDTEEPVTLVEGTDHFGVENITLYASNYVHGIAADLRSPTAGHTFVRHVCLRAVLYYGHLKPEEVDRRFRDSLKLSTGGGDSLRLGGVGVEVTDCDIYGSGRAFYLFNVRGGVVRGNRFYNGRWGWYCITGADGLIYEDNVLQGADLMSTGGGLNCLGSSFSRNVFYARNRVGLCHGWDREAMTSDAGGEAFYGPVASARGRQLILAGKPAWRGTARWPGGAVFILGGRGMGQHRRIVEVGPDEAQATLDREWDVPPDASSVVTVTMLQENYLFIGNVFEDAGIALQYYGTSINHVAQGNTSRRAGGFYNSGRWYHGYQPSWYCQFLENEILDGNGYRFGPNNATACGASFLGTLGCQRGENPAPLAYASVHRRNVLHDNARIVLNGYHAERPGVRDVIVEHNRIENTEVAFEVGPGCTGVLTRANTLVNVDREVLDPQAVAAARRARRHRLTGQEEPVFVLDFESRQGRFLPDRSGQHFLALVRSGEVLQEPGLAGSCGRFDGKGFLEVSDRALLRFPQMTLAAWVLPDRLAGRWGIVAKRKRNGAAAFVLALNHGALTFEATDMNGAWSYNLVSKPVLKEGEWAHVGAVCEEGRRVTLYCNGVEVATKEVSQPLVDNDEPLTVGFEAWGGPDRRPDASGNFRGLIDEVRLWSRLLSADELRAEYERLREAGAEDLARRRDQAARQAEAHRQLAARVAAPPGEGWELVAATSFDSPALDASWITLRGAWRVEGGTLRCREVSFLGLDRKLKPPVRIEFDGRSPQPSDLSAFFGTRADTYQGGYFIGFASNGNTAAKILRLGETVATQDGPVAVPGQWYHVICEVSAAGEIVLAVDGKPALRFADPAPVRTADTAGILAWGEGEFDNLRVYTGN